MATTKSSNQDPVTLIKRTYLNWRNDRTLRLGAGLSYYVIFSLVPIIALSIFFASILFPKERVIEVIQDWALNVFGASATEVTTYLSQQSFADTIEKGFTSLGLFGLGALIVTASFAMIALLDSVNIIWGRPVVRGWRNMVKRYAFSYLAVLSIALFLIIVLAIQSVVGFVESTLRLDGQFVEFLTNTLTTVTIWCVLVAALAWLIRLLSEQKVTWLHSLLGSAITIIFMYFGVIAIGFYLTTFSLKSVTSAFGAVLLILAWVYYESQILLAGFQLTKTLSGVDYNQK